MVARRIALTFLVGWLLLSEARAQSVTLSRRHGRRSMHFSMGGYPGYGFGWGVPAYPPVRAGVYLSRPSYGIHVTPSGSYYRWRSGLGYYDPFAGGVQLYVGPGLPLVPGGVAPGVLPGVVPGAIPEGAVPGAVPGAELPAVPAPPGVEPVPGVEALDLRRPAAGEEELPDPEPARGRSVLRPSRRGSSADARARAARLLGTGDNHFENGRYAEAAASYQEAADAAPELAEPQFRQAHAHFAQQQFPAAAEALRRGLLRDPAVQRGGFRLASLYGSSAASIGKHLEAAAKLAWDNPHQGDVLLLLGFTLDAHGQPERAVKFLERASNLAAPGDRAARVLLEHVAAPAAEEREI